MSGVFGVPARLWKLGRSIEDLFEGLKDASASIAAINSRLKALEDRVTYIEANQTQVVTEARAAAGAAATAVAGGILAEAFTRLTRLQVGLDQLPPPGPRQRLDRPPVG